MPSSPVRRPPLAVASVVAIAAGLALVAPACTTSATPPPPDAGAALDAGTDAGPAPVDAGTDSGPASAACTGEDQCGGATPHCDLATGSCGGCATDADCRGATLCDPLTGECRDCVDDADCGGAPAVCDATSRQCSRRCTTDADCPTGDAPRHCNTLGFCVDCTNGSHCGGGFCELVTFSCVSCLVDTDCVAPERCGPSYFCTATCASDTDCPDGFCDPASGLCVECATNEHCPGEICQADYTCG